MQHRVTIILNEEEMARLEQLVAERQAKEPQRRKVTYSEILRVRLMERKER